MPIKWLISEPLIFIVWITAILVALTIHEFAHAASAKYFGDDTADMMGRLTLNPVSHIDPLGFLMLLLVGFGWARPVPVNPYNLRNRRVSIVLVSFAGPASNLLAVLVFGVALRFFGPTLGTENLLVNFLFLLILVNTILLVFNLIPIPPLDGSKVLFSIIPDKYDQFKTQLAINGPFLLIMLVAIDSLLDLGIFLALFVFIFNVLSWFL